MSKRKRWTKEEDEILVQAIIANPHNKSVAFREVSAKIGRSFDACMARWYVTLSNPESKHYVGCLFTLIGIRSKLDNRTIYKEDYHIAPTKLTKRIWNKIKSLLSIK